MADRWWGQLEIENAPAEWTREVQRPSHQGGTYTEHDLDLDAMPDDLSSALDQLGDFESIERDDDGTLRLQDSQLGGGSYAFHEHGVLDALKAAGCAFRALDDGDYGNPGVYYFWRPGLTEIQARTYAAETGVVIDANELRRILAEADFTPPEPLAKALRDYFDLPLRDYFDLKPDDNLKPKEEART